MAAPAGGLAGDDGPAAEDPEVLVRGLSDESFRVREDASGKLWAMGDRALPLLKEAAASDDPERAFRARELARKIRLFITPKTDPEVAQLVERYLKASTSEKVSLLGKLQGKRAWRQMLRLFEMEDEVEFRARLQPLMNAIAKRAARGSLSRGDEDEAREFLEMGPASAEGLLALADFHRVRGALDEELERARAVDSGESTDWQLAMQRVCGNLDEAGKLAEKAGEFEVAAVMAALAGDPVPWMKRVAADLSSEDAVVYAKLAASRWQGDPMSGRDLDTLLKKVGNDVDAALALMLLGETKAVEDAIPKLTPYSAFIYFEALERIPEAMAALELDVVKPDYATWVERRFKALVEDELGGDGLIERRELIGAGDALVMMASFLERRGLDDEAYEAFAAPLKKLAEDDINMFIELMGRFFGDGRSSSSPRLARRVGLEWAGDEERLWDELLVAAFGDQDQPRTWWKWLEEISPETGRVERLDVMLALFDVGGDPQRLREKWMKRIWQAVDAADEEEKPKLAARVSSLSIRAGDLRNSLRAFDLLNEQERKQISWRQRIVELSGAGRWQEAADILQEVMTEIEAKGNEPSAHLHAYVAGALRKAGKEDEAREHDRWAEVYALGDPDEALRVGGGYTFGEDYERAARWWFRACCLAEPDSENLTSALRLHSEVLLERGDWQAAASTAEALALLYADASLSMSEILILGRQRMLADLAKALDLADDDYEAARELLVARHRDSITSGDLADYFFPALRKAGLMDDHDRFFEETWGRMSEVIALYPECDNTLNTAAWFASRAARRLDEAEAILTVALQEYPYQAAYLDTRAEIEFSRGNREGALQWSAKAINYSPEDSQLRKQNSRFRLAPFPNE
ncbi:MAG: hypothetical protein Q7R22_007900 [Verrucomicrobiota bacterium JB025]|nr:hypothetical protein [Verrucomicrobiota bacterium JB025]